jgi:O-antigen/teichoic acid export membrane protein
MKYLRAKWNEIQSSKLARNASWMMLGQGIGFLSQALYFVFLARLLGKVQYGIFVGSFAFVSVVSNYSTMGADTVFLRYVSADKSKFRAYWGNILLLIVSISLFLAVGLHFAAPFVVNSESARVVFPIALSVCFCTQIAYCAGRVFQAFEQLHITALMNLLTNVMRLIAAVVMMVVLHRVTALQWSLVFLAVSLVGVVVAVATVTVKFGLPSFHPALIKKHAAEGLQYSFSQSTSTIYNDIDKTMLSHYGMNAATGIYAMAYRAVDVATIPIFSIRDAAMPRFFRNGREGIRGSASLAKSLLGRTMLIGLASALLLFIVAPLIPLIVGPDFADSASALRWLCLIPFFRSVHQITGCALTGAGLQRYRTSAQLVAAAFNFALNLWMIPRYGWLGAAWASLITDGGLGLMNWLLMKHLATAEANRKLHTV